MSAVLMVVVLATAGGLVWWRGRGTSTAAQVGPLQVTASLSSGGRLVGTELPPITRTGWATPLSRPIRLEVAGGRLDGVARLEQRLPSNLPAEIDPAEDVYFLTRHQRTGQWIPVGGTYDPARRSVSLEVTHLSDWVLGATDPQQILADVARAKTLRTAGGRLAQLAVGNTPSLNCSYDGETPKAIADVRPLVDLLIQDIEPRVQACMVLDAKSGQFELEVVNPHGFPLRLLPPEGVSVQRKLFGDEGVLQTTFTRVFREQDRRVMLQAESKVRFLVNPEMLGPDTQIVGQLDLPAYLFNTTLWLVDVLLKGRQLERAQGIRSDDKAGIERLAEDLFKQIGRLDCFATLGNQLQDKLQRSGAASTVKLAWEFAVKAATKCGGPIKDLFAKTAASAAGEVARAGPKEFLKVITSQFKLFSSTARQVRSTFQVFLTPLALDGRPLNQYRARVRLTPDLHIEQALPALGEHIFQRYLDPYLEQRPDPRRLDPASSEMAAFLLTDDCARGIHFLNQWAGPKMGAASYLLRDGSGRGAVADFRLIPIRPAFRPQVEQYLTGTKDRCLWEPEAPVAGGFTKRPARRYGRISVAYAVDSGTAVFGRSLAYSRGYLLVGTVEQGPDTYLQLLDRGFDFAARKADAALGTAFVARK